MQIFCTNRHDGTFSNLSRISSIVSSIVPKQSFVTIVSLSPLRTENLSSSHLIEGLKDRTTFESFRTDILTIFQDGLDDPLDYPRELDEMMGRTFAFRIKWQKEWRQGSVIEIKDSRDLVKKIQIAESSKSIPLEIGVESSKSTPVKIVVDSSRSTPLQIADSLALDDIVMELSSTSEHDHNQLTKITPSKRPPVKEHDDEKLPGQLSSNKPAKMKLRNVKLEKAGL
ncbi:hypothetical protein QL285_076932 [Trifolium repens]|nr:hypothetical protein QL285_076932 [Trifolium repens]